MITINLKTLIITALTITLIFISPVKGADNTLTINHVAENPNGETQVLFVEVIENINDLYFYRAAQSPVASKLLKSGYSLKNEKNNVIEADVVSNGGKIDLVYVPKAQRIFVTYYEKPQKGDLVEIGTIEDTAYVGQKYTPALPDGGTGSRIIKDNNEDYLVRFGENKFLVVYETIPHNDSIRRSSESTRERSSESTIERLSERAGGPDKNLRVDRYGGYAYGYDDNTFRPGRKLTKGELFSLLYHILEGNENEGINIDKAAKSLHSLGIIKSADLKQLASSVTWEEFYGYAGNINKRLADGNLKGVNKETWGSYVNPGDKVTRAQAVTVINAMIDKENTIADNRFTDVYEDYWAYNEILKAVIY